MSSKYPNQFDMFQTKRNAQFDGDPNGDYVMAEDINELQDAISAIEKVMGINPQGNKLSVGDRITLLEGSSVLRVPPFLLYLGNPALINGVKSIDEAISHYLKYDHIVFGNEAESESDTDHEVIKEIVSGIKASRDIKIYGYVDAGLNTSGLEISEIQNKVQSWKDMGVTGIYCGNFDFKYEVNRERQNLILDSIHQHGLVAIISGDDPTEVLSNPYHESMNPEQLLPNIKEGDIFHYDGFVINTLIQNPYESFTIILAKLRKLHEFRKTLGINILATPTISSNVGRETAEEYFEYAHNIALLGSVDMFYPVLEGYGQSINLNKTYNVPSVVGDWYVTVPNIALENGEYVRETTFGKIYVDPVNKKTRYEGLYIPYELLKIAANSIDGSLIKDGTIKDIKIENYDGQRLITAINDDMSIEKIDISKISTFAYDDIDGVVPVDKLSANVIQAINAYIGTATIDQAFIGDLSADKITAGDISAERIAAAVVEAINLKATSAVIDEASIGHLNASKIVAGDIDADRIKASVISAINASIENATIDQAYIGDLSADKITAGDIDAQRIQSEVVNAINMYTESLSANKAVINSASIGQLTAGHIQSEVIHAINMNAGNATIDNAIIGDLDVENMKANVVEAVNAYIGTATIDSAHIGDLSADKITAGVIDADRLIGAVVEAINLSADSATIDQAHIGELNADKITTGDLNAERIAAGVIDAINMKAQNLTATDATIDNAVIGALTSTHIESAVIDAINANIGNATIDNAVIGQLEVDNMKAAVIQAVNASIEDAVIDQAVIGELDASKITTGDLDAERIKTNVISAVNASIENATIDAAHIGQLTADHMKAGVIEAVNASIENARIDSAFIGELTSDHIKGSVIEAINASIESATIDSAHIGELTSDKIATAVIDAINANIGSATIDNAVIGELEAGHIRSSVIEAINSYTGEAVIGQARIGNLSADKITTGDIDAERIATGVINAINANIGQAHIDKAIIPELESDHIKAGVIDAINANIGEAVIDKAIIPQLDSQHLIAGVIEAVNASIENATIDAAAIGELTADHIKSAVIEAINISTDTATINEAQISDLSAEKIKTGSLDASVMTANIIDAVNANISAATIDSAHIGSLTSDKIETAVIDAINANIGSAHIDKAVIPELDSEHITTSVIEAINANIGLAEIDTALIGALGADHIKAAVIDAINANIDVATINKAIIPELDAEHIATNVIDAINANLGEAVIDSAVIGDIDARKITTGELSADIMKAGVVEAINASLDNARIESAKIGELEAGHIVGTVIEAINASLDYATIDSAKIGELNAEHIQTAVIDAINANLDSATINSAKIGELTSDHIRSAVVDAINANIGSATIDQAVIGELDATKITTGDIDAERIATNVITAINADLSSATIDAAQIGELTSDHIKSNVIEAINASIETATIDAAQIGELTADNMKARVIEAVNASLSSATIDQAHIGDLSADKITTGDIDAERLRTTVIEAINASIGFATIDSAKISDLTADKIVAGDIDAQRIKATVVEAINAYAEEMTIGSALIDTGALGTLQVKHLQSAVIQAINASFESAVIDSAKIGELTADKITAGTIDAQRITGTVVEAINLYADTMGTLDQPIRAGVIGELTADHIKTSVIEAINASLEFAQIDQARIGDLDASKIVSGEIDTEVLRANIITAINASIESAQINQAHIGDLNAEKITAGNIDAERIQTNVVEAINAYAETVTAESAKIGSAAIGQLQADRIQAEVIKAINMSTGNLDADNAKIGHAAIGKLLAGNIEAGEIKTGHLDVGAVEADNIHAGAVTTDKIFSEAVTAGKIAAGAIETDHITVGTLNGDRITGNTIHGDKIMARTLSAEILKAGSITATEIASGSITARELAVGSVTADQIRAGVITAQHISTGGLDAQHITIYDGKSGETLIGSGYLRVDGLDVGVVQSDNLVANGLFLSASSNYGYLRNNPIGEAVLGTRSKIPGGHQVWKYELSTGLVKNKIDVNGSKPIDIAIDSTGRYAYVTIEGDSKLKQVDLQYNIATDLELTMGKGPGRIKYTGGHLGDMKHLFVLGTDPKDLNIPDALMIIDAPPTSVNKQLYLHHQIPVGNNPFDLVVDSSKHVYVTQSAQGDIAVVDASDHNSMKWKVVRNIPIAPFGTDNYHGGLGMEFGLNEAVGGDAASQYTNGNSSSLDDHHHGGYGSVGTNATTTEPRGIAVSSDPEILYVVDRANNELVIVDKYGNAPYNMMTGRRSEGNLGDSNTAAPGMGDSTDRLPAWWDPNTPLSDPTDTDAGTWDSGEDTVHAHSTFTVMDTSHAGHTSENGNMSGPTTKWVWYRIPIGDTPEFVEVINDCVVVTLEGSGEIAIIHEHVIIDQLNKDRAYYADWDEFENMAPIPSFHVDKVYVGARPGYMLPLPNAGTKGEVYVSVSGQNQIVCVDLDTHQVTKRINAGPNPRGLAISPDGLYLYSVNYGGSGNLSFVFPEGPYIGDPFLGLEGGIEYQGADGWVPFRSDWVFDENDNVQSNSTVEFRINEPFLNEGGYTKLATYGIDTQRAYIQQDITDVVNYSNGDNIRKVIGERLKMNESFTKFFPANPWIPGTVSNVTIVGLDVTGERVTRIPDPSTYVIHEDLNIFIEFPLYQATVDETTGEIVSEIGVKEGEWVEADYTHKSNVYFKPHNGSVLIAIDSSSSNNFDTKFEIEEFVPKFLVFDNQDTGEFIYKDGDLYRPANEQEKIDYENYTGLKYSFFSHDILSVRSNNLPIENVTASHPIVANTMDPNDAEALDKAINGSYPQNVFMWPWQKSAAGVHEFGAHNNPERFVTMDGAGRKEVVIDLGKTIMIAHNDFWMRWDNDSELDIGRSYTYQFNMGGSGDVRTTVPRTYVNIKMESSEDGVNWYTWFEGDVRADWLGQHNGGAVAETEGVPFGETNWEGDLAIPGRYVRYSGDGWEHRDPDTGAVLGSGTSFDLAHVQVYGDWELNAEFSKDYAYGLGASNIQVVGGTTEVEYGTETIYDVRKVVHPRYGTYDYFDAGTGNTYIQLDLGGLKPVDHIRVWHYYLDKRMYNGTKTEISADGVTWTTVFDSAIDGAYRETPAGHMIDLGGEKQIRYIRDWLSGSDAELDADKNRWIGIQALHQYKPDYEYIFPPGSEREGQNLATNGRGFVTTDIKDAFIAFDLDIEFTSWWYMTYIVGPQFGEMDVEMPTVMGGSHSLFYESPYLSNVAHRHIMEFTPGRHRIVLRQKTGRVSFDRVRVEDYQYYRMSSTLVKPSELTSGFERYKIVADDAKWYRGVGKQSTQGAYDSIRINPETGLPDGSVSIKYRMRVLSELNPASVTIPERGIAYVTSAIFETGKLHTHWRMSQASDKFPGSRIEAWDGNQPHKTGIQFFHLANGAVRGSKILSHSIMDHHISPYARIMESKLQLNHPTHGHGHYMTMDTPMGPMPVWYDNKHVIDSIHDWGVSGTSNKIARADHTHEQYVEFDANGIIHDQLILGTDLSVVSGVKIDGVDLSLLDYNVTQHIDNADIHFSATERTKLSGISEGANKVTGSTNGKIKIDGVDTTVYAHPSGDGNLHVPATSNTSNGAFLKAGVTAGSLSWVKVDWNDLTNKPVTYTPPIASASVLGGVKQGSGVAIAADGTISLNHPTTDGNLHVPATGTTNVDKVLKAGATAGSLSWGQVQFSELGGTLSDAQHGARGGGTLHAEATQGVAGFMSAADKAKLDGIEEDAINQTSADARYLQLTGGTIDGLLYVKNNELSAQTITFDGSSSVGLRLRNANGYINLTPLNTGWAHIYTDRSNFIFDKSVYSYNGIFSSYNSDMYLRRAGSTKLTLGTSTSTFSTEVVGTTFKKADGVEVSYAGHRHDNATLTADGFMSKEDKQRLDSIESSAINQTTGDLRYVRLAGSTMTGDLLIANSTSNSKIELGKKTTAETPQIDFNSSGLSNDYDVRISAEGGTSALNGDGKLNIDAKEVYVDGDINLLGMIDGVDLAALKSSFDLHVASPAVPTNLTASESGGSVLITFTPSTTVGVTEYEIWSSIGSNANYKLIKTMTQKDIGVTTSVSFTDDSVNRRTTVYYRVYAVKAGTRSEATERSITLINNVPDPSGLVITPEIESFAIEYELPEDIRLQRVEIWMDKQTTTGALSEVNAVKIYQGKRDSYVYRIPEEDYDKYHQFWVRSITKL